MAVAVHHTDTTVLSADRLTKTYGGVRALSDFSADFLEGSITAIVGANGAGKTTLLDCLSGRIAPDDGEIWFNGIRTEGLAPHERARHGIARSFQDAGLFDGLTVHEMLRLAFELVGRRTRQSHSGRSARRDDRRAKIETALDYFNLRQVADERLRNLSLGMLRVTMLASLSVSDATVWLLDEPASGLARAEVDRLGPLLRALAVGDRRRCIILVEHDASIVDVAADRVILLDRGCRTADALRGTAAWTSALEGGSSAFRDEPDSSADTRPPPANVAVKSKGDVLSGHDLTVFYGKFPAIQNVAVDVVAGEIRALVGSNGAGKSTVLRCLAGLISPTKGDVTLGPTRLTAPADVRVRRHGVVLVAGGRTLFPHLTVAENLRLTRRGDGVVAEALAVFPRLEEKSDQLAGSLSGGEQQMLAIARALQLRPRYLLIDELTLGLSEQVADQVLSTLEAITATRRVGVLLVEQDYRLALARSTFAYVLGQGRLVYSGPSTGAAERPDLFRPVFLAGDV